MSRSTSLWLERAGNALRSAIDRIPRPTPEWVRRSTPCRFIRADELPCTPLAREQLLDASIGRPARLRLAPPHLHHPAAARLGPLCFAADGAAGELTRTEYTSQPADALLLRDARVHPHWGLVQVEAGCFIEESAGPTRWLSRALSGLPRLPLRAGGHLDGVANLHGSDVCRSEPPGVRLDGAHLLLHHWAAHNYGHFCMDCLPGPYLLREELRSGKLALLCRPLTAWQRRSLQLLGIPAEAIRETKASLVEVGELVYPLALNCGYTLDPGPVNVDVFAALRAGVEASASAPARIYVNRDNRRHSRVMDNEQALRRALQARGFMSVDPGELSVDEQIGFFSRAEIVVGVLGAGLTNTAFAPAGCAIVEILPAIAIDTWIASLASLLGQRYVYIVASVQEHERRSVTVHGRARRDIEYRFEAPLSETLAAVDALIAGSQASRRA